MDQKPRNIYILIIIWIIIGIIFIGMVINSLIVYFSNTSIYDKYLVSIGYLLTPFTFSIVYGLILFTFLGIISFLLAYKTFVKKELFWLIGLMFSSYLITYFITGINFICIVILSGYIAQFFSNIQIIVYTFFIFLVPCQIFLFSRPEVKDYFRKQIKENKPNQIKTINKIISKTIECPVCKETLEIQGMVGEQVEITCKKCNSKGFFKFR